jgi:hypothetical protein
MLSSMDACKRACSLLNLLINSGEFNKGICKIIVFEDLERRDLLPHDY